MIVLAGAAIVLPDRIVSAGTLEIDGDRIVGIHTGVVNARTPPGVGFQDHWVVPGFIDVHVHGIEGVDALDPGNPIRSLASRLPRYGVTAFCPTSVACTPVALARMLGSVRAERGSPAPRTARVLPAHLESNFVNPEYRGAQPAECLRSPREALDGWMRGAGRSPVDDGQESGPFDGADIIREVERSVPDIAYFTLASELEGGLDLVRWLVARGIRVSLGHSAATYDEALTAIGAGASHVAHLFNRMAPIGHRAPGLAGAVLQSADVTCELICDGFHVHPALIGTAVAAKQPARSIAITDATAAAGLPVGGRARLGGQHITVGESAAYLDDGTVAGSVATMDQVFRTLVGPVGLSLVEAAAMCATTPARELGLVGRGALAVDAVADLTVLDERLNVVQTYVGGQLVYARD